MTDAPNSPEPSSPNPSQSSADTPPEPTLPHVAPGDRWTRYKMACFLRALAASSNVSAAARSVGMSRQSAYRLRNRLKGTPFDIGWEAALHHGYDNLAHAALDRALNGVEVPHYYKGEQVGTSRKYDERLTIALLTMRNRFGAPMLGRYGAAAEFYGERWDALLRRIEDGPVDWQFENAEFSLKEEADALEQKYAPEAKR